MLVYFPSTNDIGDLSQVTITKPTYHDRPMRLGVYSYRIIMDSADNIIRITSDNNSIEQQQNRQREQQQENVDELAKMAITGGMDGGMNNSMRPSGPVFGTHEQVMLSPTPQSMYQENLSLPSIGSVGAVPNGDLSDLI